MPAARAPRSGGATRQLCLWLLLACPRSGAAAEAAALPPLALPAAALPAAASSDDDSARFAAAMRGAARGARSELPSGGAAGRDVMETGQSFRQTLLAPAPAPAARGVAQQRLLARQRLPAAAGAFACPAAAGAGAASVCEHGGALAVVAPSQCACRCVGAWTGPTCAVCAAQDCAHGGVWDSAACACACQAPWRAADHCATCEPHACAHGGVFNAASCACDCAGLWRGRACDACSVDEGDAERTERLCGRHGFSPAACACNAACPASARCLHGGVLDAQTCACDCGGGSPVAAAPPRLLRVAPGRQPPSPIPTLGGGGGAPSPYRFTAQLSGDDPDAAVAAAATSVGHEGGASASGGLRLPPFILPVLAEALPPTPASPQSLTFWAGDRCQVCLPPARSPCAVGWLFSADTCACEPLCPRDACLNGGVAVLLNARPSGSSPAAGSPGAAPATLLALGSSGGSDGSVGGDAASSAAAALGLGRALRRRSARDAHAVAKLDYAANYALPGERLDALRAGTRCGCRCAAGWAGAVCDIRASGASAASAARSCLAIRAIRPHAGSGRYWINPSGVSSLLNAFQVFCDMGSTDGAPAAFGVGAANGAAKGAEVGGWVVLARVGEKLSGALLDGSTFLRGVRASGKGGDEFVVPCGRFDGLDGTYAPPLTALSAADIEARSAAASAATAPAPLRRFVLRVQMGAVTDYFTSAAEPSAAAAATGEGRGRGPQPFTLCDMLTSSQRHLWSPILDDSLLDGSAQARALATAAAAAVASAAATAGAATASRPLVGADTGAPPADDASDADADDAGSTRAVMAEGRERDSGDGDDGKRTAALEPPHRPQRTASLDDIVDGGARIAAGTPRFRRMQRRSRRVAHRASTAAAAAATADAAARDWMRIPTREEMKAAGASFMPPNFGAPVALSYPLSQQRRQSLWQPPVQQPWQQLPPQLWQQQQPQSPLLAQAQRLPFGGGFGGGPGGGGGAYAVPFALPPTLPGAMPFRAAAAGSGGWTPSLQQALPYGGGGGGSWGAASVLLERASSAARTGADAGAGVLDAGSDGNGEAAGASAVPLSPREWAEAVSGSDLSGSAVLDSARSPASEQQSQQLAAPLLLLEANGGRSRASGRRRSRLTGRRRRVLGRRRQRAGSTAAVSSAAAAAAATAATAASAPGWRQPAYVDLKNNPQLADVLGGSALDWPLALDGRRYLAIWGGKEGGCCNMRSARGAAPPAHDAGAADAARDAAAAVADAAAPVDASAWGRAFTMSVIEVDAPLFARVRERERARERRRHDAAAAAAAAAASVAHAAAAAQPPVPAAGTRAAAPGSGGAARRKDESDPLEKL